ncbi:unnamed protein product [Acanthosepion pharaonis]|uniref:Chitin-binding type-2 domain-containing protein n=1 Tax=Acanthosepion pharaonis TaxID=158019 RepID=A0A812CK74_ACAPH|nr:unnamed protein product [Sepia pharaonis]
MQRILTLFLVICSVGLSRSVVCKGKPDGIYEVSCLSLGKCINGKLNRILCPIGEVIDTDVHQCKPMAKVKPPCGKAIDCSQLKDGRHPDYDQNCRSYYTCLAGRFLGHNFCPSSLIFNDELKLLSRASESCISHNLCDDSNVFSLHEKPKKLVAMRYPVDRLSVSRVVLSNNLAASGSKSYFLSL